MREINLEGWREKLLEMTKALFPEYEKHYFGGTDRMFICIYRGQASKGDGICVHWYEFVHTFLAERVFNPNPMKIQRGIQDRMKEFFWHSNIYWYNRNTPKGADTYDYNPLHPIDYLYQIFKDNEDKQLNIQT